MVISAELFIANLNSQPLSSGDGLKSVSSPQGAPMVSGHEGPDETVDRNNALILVLR